jgi:hypothetical protein
MHLPNLPFVLYQLRYSLPSSGYQECVISEPVGLVEDEIYIQRLLLHG